MAAPPGEAVHGAVPLDGIARERRGHQPCLLLEPQRDVLLQVAAQRALGAPEQHPDHQHENEDDPEHEPGREAHRGRAPRSVPPKR